MTYSKAREESNKRYDEKTYVYQSIKIRKDSGLLEGVDCAVKSGKGKSKNDYMISAIREKLISDGITIEMVDSTSD